jgi:prepilin peptidase CpaA
MTVDWYFKALGMAFLATLLFATISDVRSRTVPNYFTLVLLGLFGLWIIPQASVTELGSALGAMAIALSFTFLLWHFDIVGGADVKVFTVCAMFAGLEGLGQFAGWTALVGGLAAIGLLLTAVMRRGPTAAMRDSRNRRTDRASVPYVVAISAGAIITALNDNWFRLVSA